MRVEPGAARDLDALVRDACARSSASRSNVSAVSPITPSGSASRASDPCACTIVSPRTTTTVASAPGKRTPAARIASAASSEPS